MLFAAEMIGLKNTDHLFASEKDKHVREILINTRNPKLVYEDVTTRIHKEAPPVQIYGAGFPCQTFSTMGQQMGRCDARGMIITTS